MTCWRNSCDYRFILICLTFLALNAPLSLQAQAPVPLQPAPLAPPAQNAPPPLQTPEDAIVTGTLKEPDISGVGLLDETNGGFGRQTWRGADGGLVAQLVPQIPSSTPSASLQELTRRLMLSDAEPPAGLPGGVSFLALRVEKLLQAGQVELAGRLANLAGANTRDERLQRARAEIALVQGETNSACAHAAANIRESSDAFWLKLTGFCQALKGDEAAAQLSAELAAEQDADDAGYQALLTALLHKTGNLRGKAIRPDILKLAMIRSAELPIPDSLFQNASAVTLQMAAQMPQLSPEARLAVAERAAAAGALAPEELTGLYGAMKFSPEDRAKAIERAPKMPAPAANALLFQVVQGQEPFARGPALAAAWSQARTNDSFPMIARVHLNSTRELFLSPDLLPIAPDAGRALLAAGDVNAAGQWYALARGLQSLGPNPGAHRTMHSLWPLLWIAQSAEVMADDPGAMIAAWLAQLPPGQKTRQGPLMLTTLAALGLVIPDSAWITLMTDQKENTGQQPVPPPSPVMLHMLSDASSSGRTGLTVLLGLCLMGEQGAYLAEPLALGPVLEALNQTGLHKEARALAMDALLHAGI